METLQTAKLITRSKYVTVKGLTLTSQLENVGAMSGAVLDVTSAADQAYFRVLIKRADNVDVFVGLAPKGMNTFGYPVPGKGTVPGIMFDTSGWVHNNGSALRSGLPDRKVKSGDVIEVALDITSGARFGFDGLWTPLFQAELEGFVPWLAVYPTDKQAIALTVDFPEHGPAPYRHYLTGQAYSGASATATRRHPLLPTLPVGSVIGSPPTRLAGELEWSEVPQGGGGSITAVLKRAVDGLAWCGTDVQNCYLRRPRDSKWVTVFRRDTLPEEDVGSFAPSNMGHGLASCMAAWGGDSTDTMYSHFNAKFYTITIDHEAAAGSAGFEEAGALKCERWNLPDKYLQGNNGQAKSFLPGMCGHPTDKNICLVGTWNDGAYYTKDMGKTVHEIALPRATGGWDTEKGRGRLLVLIDPGDPSFCYVHVTGVGLHRSVNGVEGPYELLADGPSKLSSLFCESDGTLWMTTDARVERAGGGGTDYSKTTAEAGIWRLDRGSNTFRHYGNPYTRWAGYHPKQIAVDPSDPNRIVTWMYQEGFVSLDRGESWKQIAELGPAGIVAGGEVKWRTSPRYFIASSFAFDHQTEGRVLWGEGFGVAVTHDIYNGKLEATDYSAGIEEFIINHIYVDPETGALYMSAWDRPFLPITDLVAYTNVPVMPPQGGLYLGSSVVGSIDDPNFLVVGAGTGVPQHSYSDDGGKSLKLFEPDQPYGKNYPRGGGSAGPVAVSSSWDIVINQSNNWPAIETRGRRDPVTGKALWSVIELGGRTDYQTIPAYYVTYMKNVAADRARPGHFAFVVPTNNPSDRNDWDHRLGGLWVREGRDAPWVQTQVGVIGFPGYTYREVSGTGQDARQFWGGQLEYVHEHPGEMLWTGHADYNNDRFFHIRSNGRAGVVELNPDIRNVYKFAQGKNIEGAEYPAIMFYGQVRRVSGYWLTLDWFKSFELISDKYPMNIWNAGINHMGGDMTRFGRWYVSSGGKGSMFTNLLGTSKTVGPLRHVSRSPQGTKWDRVIVDDFRSEDTLAHIHMLPKR